MTASTSREGQQSSPRTEVPDSDQGQKMLENTGRGMKKRVRGGRMQCHPRCFDAILSLCQTACGFKARDAIFKMCARAARVQLWQRNYGRAIPRERPETF